MLKQDKMSMLCKIWIVLIETFSICSKPFLTVLIRLGLIKFGEVANCACQNIYKILTSPVNSIMLSALGRKLFIAQMSPCALIQLIFFLTTLVLNCLTPMIIDDFYCRLTFPFQLCAWLMWVQCCIKLRIKLSMHCHKLSIESIRTLTDISSVLTIPFQLCTWFIWVMLH